ncbi:phosphoinositide 3-kinase adapter protein 1-like isoform X2 [Mercenaria mercenaria]|uniref:phosphoinositide 3-kinase adapter protein 1-like isoform X2 n=1 Tax=Mercenaria mercenaria TaxID=6596 RepID=UPI001E1E0DE2|nr:phosphoinositide 3-kinase adapter protein 1-like isoform X2 [Mercenaria mercenaria]
MATAKQKIKEMKEILILYEEKDSKAWTEFIQGCFTECPQNLSIEVRDLKTDIQEVETLATCFSMVLVIVSNEMLNTMELQANILSPCLQKHQCVSVIKLYLQEAKYSTKIKQCYKTCKNWKEFSIGAEDGEEHVQKLISQIINELEKVAVQEKVAAPQTTPRKSRIQYICPETVRQGGEMMTLVLRKQIHEGQCVQVSVGDNETLIDTKTLNPFCFTFKAPAHKAGRAVVRLFIDGKKVAKMSVHYSSMTRFAYTCPEYLCQLLGLNPDDKTGLDKELTNIFNNSAPQDGSLQLLLSPKNLQATSSGGTEGCGELPTLLHFACKYGLNDLAVSVMHTPGSHMAVSMDNEQGLSPLDLARETKNEELVNYLECFVEMHDYVTDIEDLYERMSGGSKLEPYMNTDTVKGGMKNRYLEMGRADSVQEAYVEARVPLRLSDYEVTDTTPSFPGCPEEVKEEDDVPPEVPRRPQTAKRQVLDVPPTVPTRANQIGLDKVDIVASMPKDDFFAGETELCPGSMGSSNLDELNEYAQSYMRGEFSLDDIERLYKAWHERNRDATSYSLKERKKQLDEMRDTYQTLMSIKKDKRKKSMLFWKKKEKPVDIDIQHHVPPNKYESWTIMRGTQPPQRPHRDSTISNASTTSSSSSSSRDSALGPVVEVSSDSENSENEHKDHRQSWGDQFLKQVQNRPNSRLPKPPPTNPVYVKHKLPSTPEIPPRPQAAKPIQYTK